MGAPCSMNVGLDMNATDDYVFSVVNEVVRGSSLTRETFKEMILEENETRRRGSEKLKKRLESEIKRFNKDIGIFQELITKSNVEHGLKEISYKQHEKNLGDYNKQILLLEDKVSKNVDELFFSP